MSVTCTCFASCRLLCLPGALVGELARWEGWGRCRRSRVIPIGRVWRLGAITLVPACAAATAGADVCALSCPADLNGDFAVDGGDLGIMLGTWGTAGADLTGDGTTDGADLGDLLGRWGPCPAAPPCPASDHECFTTGVAGCTSVECCELACAADPFCCVQEWDALCVATAKVICLGAADCYVVNGGVGCSAPLCEEPVCSLVSSCCTEAWDEICVEYAIKVCGESNPLEPDCCLPHAYAGCGDSECAGLVCTQAPECCAVAWDTSCVEFALLDCGPCDFPIIASVAPLAAQAGDLITITGSGFPAQPSLLSIVAIDPDGPSVVLHAVSATSTEIVAQVGNVPQGFTAGQIVVQVGAGGSINDLEGLELPGNIELYPGAVSSFSQGIGARSGECVELSPAPNQGCTTISGAAVDGALVLTVPQTVVIPPPLEGGIDCGNFMICCCSITITAPCWIFGGFDAVPCPCDPCCDLFPCTGTIVVCFAFYLPTSLDGSPPALVDIAQGLGDTLAELLDEALGLPITPATVVVAPDGTVATVTIDPAEGATLSGVPAFDMTWCAP